MSTTLSSLVCVAAIIAGTWLLAAGKQAGEPTSDQVDTKQPADKWERKVDIEALRKMSIDAYKKGGNEGSLEDEGMSKKNAAISMCVCILVWAVIMVCCSVQCEKYLMRDFYRLQKIQRAREHKEMMGDVQGPGDASM